MRLTNKQMEIIVDEIYEKVSLPIIESNDKLIENVTIGTDQYQKDYVEYRKLSDKINKLSKLQKEISDKYNRKSFNGVEFDYHSMRDGEINTYIRKLKKRFAVLKPYLSKSDIEKQVILAGNKDIPSLIEELINKLSK